MSPSCICQPLLDDLRKAGHRCARHRDAAGRSEQKLRRAGKAVGRIAGYGDRPQGPDHRAGRRGDRRSHRFRRRRAQARRRFRANSHHASGAGGFLGRRQDRDQRRAGQEPDRPVPPAAHRHRRHRAAGHPAPARIAGRLCRSREIWRAGRCGILRMAGSERRQGAGAATKPPWSKPWPIPAG